MKAVAIRELKNNLSAYLREVRNGETVLVTDRGTVVAELRKPAAMVSVGGWEESLSRLEARGLVAIGSRQQKTSYLRTQVMLNETTSHSLLDAERGSE